MFARELREDHMTKFGLLGATAVLLSVLASPATARHLVSTPAHPGQSLFWAPSAGGKPQSKYCDYIAWSKWRQRGGGDSSPDNACLHNPAFVPGECGFN